MKKNNWQMVVVIGLAVTIVILAIVLIEGGRQDQRGSEEDNLSTVSPTSNINATRGEREENVIPAPEQTVALGGQISVSEQLAQTNDLGVKPEAARWQEGLGEWWFNRQDTGQTLRCDRDVCRLRTELKDGATYPAFFIDYETQKNNLLAVAENYLRDYWGFNRIVLMPDSEVFYRLGGGVSNYFLEAVMTANEANVVSWSWYWAHNGQILSWQNMPAAIVTMSTNGNVLNATITDRTPMSVSMVGNERKLLNNTELLTLLQRGEGEWLNMSRLSEIKRTEVRRIEVVWVSEGENQSVPYYYLTGEFGDGEVTQKNTVVLK
ncbi:hypothetical protein FWH30_02590 [Microgenomates group bacterium]|nr:hypothetical protein [Microgenomates group bacterium]